MSETTDDSEQLDAATSQKEQPIETEYGTVEKHVGRCRGCNFVTASDGSYDGYQDVEDTMCRHIGAPGAPCHDFKIVAVYEDGGEDRV